uniref:G_PROTEIN_RECEP_F1_2 domain-containing protein n=1 Tax=Onchocerca volvulus TaxID=6282 RepID=A0A8R1XTZ7_ONCVO
MATALFSGRKGNPYSQSFVYIASQLIISNFLAFLPQLIVVLPEILQNENSLHASTFGEFYYCTRIFRVWNLAREKKCENSSGKIWQRIRNLWVLSMPNIMFIMYAAIFYSMHLKKRSVTDISQNQGTGKMNDGLNTMKVRRYEWSVLIQAAWNCGALEVEVVLLNETLDAISALNRFVVLILPKYNIFFKSIKLYFLITLVWLLNSAVTIGDCYYCTRKFFALNLTWEKKCETETGKIFQRTFYAWTLFLPTAMFIMYVAIFYILRHKRQRIRKMCVGHKTKTAKNNYERLILIQAAWNCGALIIGVIMLNFLSSLLTGVFSQTINIPSKILINCYFIFEYAVFPTIHFIYSQSSRNLPVDRMVARSFHIIALLLVLPSTCLEKNMTKVLDIRDEHHKVLKYIAVLLFAVFLLYGIASNILMATALFSGRKGNPYSQSFVYIASQLIISNFLAFLPQLIVVLPEILQNENSLHGNETTRINYTFTIIFSFSYTSILHFSFLLALNRFVTFVLPKYNSFFKSTRLYFLITLVWLSVLASTFGEFYYCTRIFRVWNLAREKKCENSSGKIWQRIRNLWVLSMPNIMFIMYAAIFYSMHLKKRSVTDISQNQGTGKMNDGLNTMKVRRYEWSVLIQAAWNCGALEVEVVLLNVLLPILFEIFGEEITILMNIIINSYVISYCGVLSTVFFIFNKEARNIIKKNF